MSRKSKQRRRKARLAKWGFLGSDEWLHMRKRVLGRLGRACLKCGKTKGKICVDHILPKSRFPYLALDIRNLQVLCGHCNGEKGAHDMTDYRPREYRTSIRELIAINNDRRIAEKNALNPTPV